jgi:hypothetical protein
VDDHLGRRADRVAIGAQWMQRSVLDAGLAVLSYASGSVLGAFLLGTLAPSVEEVRRSSGCSPA